MERRRRGDDFFANYHFILNEAKVRGVDMIVHGGDMFFRSKVPSAIVEWAYEPLVDVANCGIPVYLVPGNHERSRLPGLLWLGHINIHVFDEPKTFKQKCGDVVVGISGFPFVRKVRQRFRGVIEQSEYKRNGADLQILCMHQTVEGAKVGPSDFMFRKGVDNIPGEMIPEGLDVVLSGHIHRSQVLTRTLDRRKLTCPVVYSGSIERTSIAERFEEKHFVIVKIDPENEKQHVDIEFHRLPTRSMVKIEVDTFDRSIVQIRDEIEERVSRLEQDAVVRVSFSEEEKADLMGEFTARSLREMVPKTMNISMRHGWQMRVTQKKLV